ncbi:MAG TPA: M28 family metallopeptidase [Anaerolineae bacterium]
MLRRIAPFVLLLFFTTLACSLLEGPPQLVLPTPIPTAPPFSVEASAETVFDPVSDVVPAVDPEVAFLVNSVSQQQLFGYVQTLQNFQTRHSYSDANHPALGIGAARLWIYNEFIRVGNGRLQVQFDTFPMHYDTLAYEQQNIVATLPGTSGHPGVIILTAHYDSRTLNINDGGSFAPGANDNASGVAVLLEVARLLSSRTWNQTVVFVAFAGEEQDTAGSRHFVSNKMLEGWIIDAALNNDIVGGRPGIPQLIRVFAPGPDTSPLRQFTRYMDLVGSLYLPQFPMEVVDARDREGRYSDHLRFLDAGVVAVRLTESQEDISRNHTAADTWDAIDYNYLRQAAQLNLATVANAVGAPPPPPSPVVAPMADPGAYILTWTPHPLADGYVISFRPVGSEEFAPFYFVNALQAGNVAITGLAPQTAYALSLAALDESGRIGLFSPEVIVGP